MRKIRGLIRRIGGLFDRQRKDRELEEEIESHVQLHIEDNLRLGMAPEEARRQAILKLGGIESTKEGYRDQRGLPVLETVWHDLHFGVRMLRKNPGFTVVVVLTLALGIGANTAIFGIVNAVMLKMLPVPEPQSLVLLSRSGKAGPPDNPPLHSNVMMYEFLRDQSHSLAGLLAFSPVHLRVRTAQEIQGVSGQLVTPNYFSLLGVGAILGRTWSAGDRANLDEAVISHRFWQSHFAGDPAVIGRTLSVSGKPVTVIGVAPPGFLGLVPGEPVDLTVPLAAQPWLVPEQGNRLQLGNATTDDPAATWPLFMLGRLASGMKAEQAGTELTLLLRQWAAGRGVSGPIIERDLYRVELEPAGKGLGGLRKRLFRPLLMLSGVVGCVFLIACANLANLLLARAASRGPEIAVRLAMGAGRIRIIRQLLTESVLLALLGGVFGIVAGRWGSSFLSAFAASGRVALDLRTDLDWRVVTATAGLSVIAGMCIGILPAVRASARSLTPALKGRTATCRGGGGRWNLSWTLVVVQLALSLCLLVGTGLFVSSLRRIMAINPGFQTKDLQLVNFDWSGAGYDSTNMLAFVEHALGRLREAPGVVSASATFLEPLGESQSFTGFSVPGVVSHGPVERNIVWPDYFGTMRIPLLGGREFDAHDTADAPRVAIINETLARSCFGNSDPVGQPVWLGREASGPPVTIVGVARDSAQRDLRDAPVRLVFLPSTQTGHGLREPTLLVREAAGSPLNPDALRHTLEEVNRDITVREITTPTRQMERGLLQERLLAVLTGFFGPLALLLAAIGLYGLLAHDTAQRTREIGVRMALGARRGDVVTLVLKRGMLLVGVGAVTGIVLSISVSHVIRGLVFAVEPDDPTTLLGAVGLLGLVALLACWLPARRATKVDPMLALRHE